MKRSLVALSFILVVVAASVACTPRDSERYACLQTGKFVTDAPLSNVVPWPRTIDYLPNGSAVDASGDRFDSTLPNSSGYRTGLKYHRKTDTRFDLCMVGGRVMSTVEPENTPWADWHRSVGIIVETDGFSVIGTSFTNQGDMIAIVGAQDFSIIGVRAEGEPGQPGAYIHDDCIENDGMASGVIDDVKLDGCNVFMSSQSSANGTGRQVEVRNSLIRLQPYANSFDVTKYGPNRHGGFFKWANPTSATTYIPPALSVSNSTFRSDERGFYGGNVNGFLGLPPGTQCDNVMLIGSETWKPTDLASWQTQCTNLRYGTVADWDAQVATWNAEHPAL